MLSSRVIPTGTDGWHQPTIAFPVPQQPDPAPRAPGRFAKPGIIATVSMNGIGQISSDALAGLRAKNPDIKSALSARQPSIHLLYN